MSQKVFKKVSDAVKNADWRLSRWKQDSKKSVQKINKEWDGTGIVWEQDIVVIGPELQTMSWQAKEAFVTKEFIETFLRPSVPEIRLPSEGEFTTTYSSFQTYLLGMVKREFGSDNVEMSTVKSGFRGFRISDPRVVDYVRAHAKVIINQAHHWRNDQIKKEPKVNILVRTNQHCASAFHR